MAYVIIVEFRAKPDRVAAFAELIDRHAYNSRTLEDGCLAYDVCQDPEDPPASFSPRPTAIRPRTDATSRWTASSGSGGPRRT
jgi:hypothetical protein